MNRRFHPIVCVLALGLICVLASGQYADKKADANKTFDEIKSLQPKIRRVAEQSEALVFSGRYRDRLDDWPSMSEEDIYVFPDHSYIYTMMNDVFPEYITDHGTWQYVNGAIELNGNKPEDKIRHNLRFLVLVVDQDGKTYQILVGLDGDHEGFLTEARNLNPQLIFTKSSYKKTQEFTDKTYTEKKKYLLQCCSKPRSVR